LIIGSPIARLALILERKQKLKYSSFDYIIKLMSTCNIDNPFYEVRLRKYNAESCTVSRLVDKEEVPYFRKHPVKAKLINKRIDQWSSKI